MIIGTATATHTNNETVWRKLRSFILCSMPFYYLQIKQEPALGNCVRRVSELLSIVYVTLRHLLHIFGGSRCIQGPFSVT